MREIKFRAWDKVNKCYYHDVQNAYDETIGDSFQDVLQNEDLVVEQYTGLKDKNGVEIYEGDIVEIKSHLYKDIIGIVKFWEFNSSFSVIKNSKEFDMPTCLSATIDGFINYEVIGNIHEQPELLEKK